MFLILQEEYFGSGKFSDCLFSSSMIGMEMVTNVKVTGGNRSGTSKNNNKKNRLLYNIQKSYYILIYHIAYSRTS
jgi:hypothetical protein